MNMALSEIEKHLKALRLHGMNSTLHTRITQANQGVNEIARNINESAVGANQGSRGVSESG